MYETSAAYISRISQQDTLTFCRSHKTALRCVCKASYYLSLTSRQNDVYSLYVQNVFDGIDLTNRVKGKELVV